MTSAVRPVSTKSSLERLFTCRSIEPTFERAGAELAAARVSLVRVRVRVRARVRVRVRVGVGVALAQG